MNLPELLDTSPAADLAAEYRKLHAVHIEATGRHRKLTEQRAKAADADRATRAAALRAGNPDPGDKHAAKLAKDIDAAQTEADIAHAARADVWRELRARLAQPDAQTWAEEVGHAPEAEARAAAALTDAIEAFAELQTARGHAAWAAAALAHAQSDKRAGHTARWPAGAPRHDLIKVRIGTYAMTPQDLINLLATAFQEPNGE